MTLETTTFLEVFFGPENEIVMPSAGGADSQAPLLDWLEPWIADLTDESRPPVILPRSMSSGQTIWYALTFSSRQYRMVREELLAFLGPTLTDFDGRPPPDPEDELEQAVAEYTDGRYFRLSVPSGSTAGERNHQRSSVRESISLMRDLHARKPVVTPHITRQVGRILRDFEWDLRALDADGSSNRLVELRATGRVSALNLAYLRIQRFSALGMPAELLDDRDLPEVVQSRRPALVTEAILVALYDRHFRRAEETSDVASALGVFQSDIATPFAALFRSRGSLDSDPVRTMFMLWASIEPPRAELQDEIFGLPGSPTALVAGLAQTATEPASIDEGPLMSAEMALDEGAFESAFARIQAIANESQELAELALRCAYELDTKESAAFAVKRMDAIVGEGFTIVGQSRTLRTWIDSAERLVSLPGSWCELIGAMNDDELPLGDAARWAKTNSDSWDLGEFASDGQELQDLILVDRGEEGRAAFRDVLPFLVTALDAVGGGASDPDVRAVYEALILHLATRQGLGAAELDALLDLVRVLFDSGVDDREYVDLVEALLLVWSTHTSRRWLTWLLEAAELVAEYPSRVPTVAASLASAVASACQTFFDQLSETESRVATDLLLQFGFDEQSVGFLAVVHQSDDGSVGLDMSGLHVAVYTLARGVGERVRRLLEGDHPGIDVSISSDHVGSTRLREMARNSDVFVVATRASKHAATEFIKQHRQTTQPTIYPRGKGSSSIIDGLYSWAEETHIAS